MKILLEVAKDASAWSRALSERLPEASIHQGPRAPRCDYAVVWRPSPEVFQRQTQLKAIFSLGAGVDGLLSMPSLPRQVPLIRMEDVGMADQMFEYVLSWYCPSPRVPSIFSTKKSSRGCRQEARWSTCPEVRCCPKRH